MNTPYETYNNQIGVRLSFIVKEEAICHPDSLRLLSYSAYEKRAIRHKGFKLRAGLGFGNEVLLSWNNLPQEWQYALEQKFGNPVLEVNHIEKFFFIDEEARRFYDGFTFADGLHLRPEQISQYTINSSVLQAFAKAKRDREIMHKRQGNSSRGLWPGLLKDLACFNNILKAKYDGIQHTLPGSERRIREDLKGFAQLKYEYYVDGRNKNAAAAKISNDTQHAMLEQLLKNPKNLDNEQVAYLYNAAATALGWKAIDASTVALYRKKLGLYIYGGNRGESQFDNNLGMQVKRRAPSASMAFWTMDSWDAELLYQEEIIDKKGHKKTTYHNRMTVCVVLDPVAGLDYPIGYAIGTHETPDLITAALRDAANHTKELFGARYKPKQLQSDRYALKALTPVYEAMSEYFTPARVKNAKSKKVERHFASLNKLCQMYFKNWSGFNVTSTPENQPNSDYLNQIRHSFPDKQGCINQIHRLIALDRKDKTAEYVQRFEDMPVAERLPLSNAEYLYLFGQTHSHTNKLKGSGLTPILLGEQRAFDCFDIRFRENGYMDWAIKYDPENLDSILVLNAKSDANGKLDYIVGTHRFELQAKYIQPMALYDRKDGDNEELQKVFTYNKELKAGIIERAVQKQVLIDEVFTTNPQLNDTLTKLMLVDSDGQHKNQRNLSAGRASSKMQELEITENSYVTPAPSPMEEYEIIEDDVRKQY